MNCYCSQKVSAEVHKDTCSKCHNKSTQLLYICTSGDVYRPYPQDQGQEKIIHCKNWCRGLHTCKCAHSEFEYNLWKDEKEILRAVLKPRSYYAISKKGTIPSICRYMITEGHCRYGQKCFFPHSSRELAKLEARIKDANNDEKISGNLNFNFTKSSPREISCQVYHTSSRTS